MISTIIKQDKKLEHIFDIKEAKELVRYREALVLRQNSYLFRKIGFRVPR